MKKIIYLLILFWGMRSFGQSIRPASPSFCPGESVQLSVSPATGITAYNWLNGATSVGTNPTYNANVIGNFSVRIKRTGKPDTTLGPVSVKQNPLPVAGFTASPSGECSNKPMVFTNTSTGGATYSWDFGDPASGGNNTSTAASPTHVFVGAPGNGTQTFTVTQTVTTALGCSASKTLNVTTTQVADGTLGGTGRVDYNGSVYFTTCGASTGDFIFTNQSITQSTNTAYKIVWGDGSPDFTADPSFSITTHTYGIGSHPILFIVTGQNGCIDTTRYFAFVGTNPAVGLNNPGNTLACSGESLTFPITGVASNAPGTVYTVTFNDGTQPITYVHPDIPTSVTHIFDISSCNTTSSNGTNVYNNSFSANIVAQNPCNSSAATVVPIYISKKPRAAFDISPSDTVCVNSTVTFTNTSESNFVNGGSCLDGNSIWSITPATGWNILNNGTLGNDFGQTDPSVWQSGSPVLNVNFSVPGIYSIKIRTGNAKCGIGDTTQTICVTVPPVPAFSLSSTSGCSPFNVTATNTTTSPNSCKPPVYQWSVTYAPAFCGTDSSWSFAPGSSDSAFNASFVFKNPGNYTIQLAVTNVCSTYTLRQTVNVKKAPSVGIGIPSYPCGPVTIKPVSNDTACATGTLTYAWTFAGGLPDVAATRDPGTVSFSALGGHAIRLSVTNECGTTTATDNVTVTTAPDVKVPPDQGLCGGKTAGPYAFSSTIVTPTYSWTNSNPSIGLAASGTGDIPAFEAINNGTTPVVATIIVTPVVSGDCQGIPDTFLITVNPRPAAPVAAATAFTYCLNTLAPALSATVTGTNKLRWYTNPNLTGGSDTAPIPPTNAAATLTYYVTQVSDAGCESPATVITVTVNPAITGNQVGRDQNICSATIPDSLRTVNAIGGGDGTYSFIWQSSADGVTWTSIPSSNNASYGPTVLTTSLQYRRIINSATCSDTSNTVKITVQGALSSYNIGVAQTVCSQEIPDSLIGELPSGGGGNYTYLWESSTDNSSWLATRVTTKDFQSGPLAQTTYFRRRVFTAQCEAVSNIIEITVKPLPAGTLAAPVKALCTTDAGNISFTLTTGTAPANIELVVNRAGGTDTIRQTVNTTTASIPVITAGSAPGRYIITLISITDANGCRNISDIAKDTIDIIRPIINIIGRDSIICAGNSVQVQTLQLAGGNSASLDSVYTFQWESTPAGQTNWQLVAGATESTLSVTPANSTCYRRKVKSNGLCESISNAVCITVNGTIGNNGIAAAQRICVNQPVDSLLGGAPTGGDNTYTYQWQTSTDSINWSNVATTIGYKPSPYAVAGVYYFRRNVSSGGCTASSNVIAITVRPDTKALFAANSTTVCSNADLTRFITVTPFPDGNSLYQWYADGVLFGSNTTGVFPAYSIANPSDTVIIKLVTTSADGCKPDSIQQQFITLVTAQARFTKDLAAGCGPLRVNFTNTSNLLNGIQFSWDFGNGKTSTDAQPGAIDFESSPFFTDTTYLISLKAFNGCDTTTWLDSVKVRANPKARFGVDTTFGCSPFTIQINNTSPGGPNTYYWDFGDGKRDTTTTNGSFSHRYNIGNTVDTITIRLIAENECRRDTQAINIRIAPNPIRPLINVNSSELFGCVSHTVQFNNNTFGATQFTWNYGDGSATEITNNTNAVITHTYTSPGTFTASIGITNGCSDTTVFREITVYPKPTANFSTNKTLFCEGDSVRVTNNSTNATNYRWFWGDGSSSAGDNPVHVYTVAGNYNIVLQAQQSNGTGIVCIDSFGVPVTVLAQPVVTVQSNISSINCAPFTLNVTAPGIINENVTWSFYDSTVTPSVITATGVSAQYTFNKPGTYSVKLFASNANNCSDSTIINFTVRGKAVASFTPPSLAVCTTDTTIHYLNTTTYNGTDPISYQWLVDGALVSTGANFTHQYTVNPQAILPRVFNTSLVVSNTVGCSDTAVAQLQMNPRARAQFAITNQRDCPVFLLKINNNSTYAGTYQWLVNGVAVSNDSIPVIIITEGSTLYTISLVADNIYGCKPDTFSVSFTSTAKPNAAFTLSDTLGCDGRLNVLTNNLTTGASAYNWSWGDGTSDAPARNYSHLYTGLGQYLVRMVASDGNCADTAEQIVRVSVKPTADFSVNQTLTCDTARVQFTNLSTNGSTYIWSFGDGTSSTAVDPLKSFAPGTAPYTVKLVAVSDFGCKDSLIKPNLVLAKVPPAGDFLISPSAVINVPDYTFSFNNLTLNSANYKYLWSLGDGTFEDSRDVTHKYADTGSYAVRLIVLDTISNCPDTTIHIARINGFPGYLFVPNAFYPNSARTEFKTFKPLGKGLADYQLQIFDSWGKLLFETRLLDANGSPAQGWDGTINGKPMPQDTYAWKIKATFRNGRSWDGMVYSNMPGKTKGVTFGTINLFR